jgi:hypothetical protein
MKLQVKAFHTFIEHQFPPREGATGSAAEPLHKVAVVALVQNPYAGRYVEDLAEMIAASVPLGEQIGKLLVEAMGSHPVRSYGKGAIVGSAGDQEHAAALLTTAFAEPVRAAVGGGKAWISSFTKVAALGASIDIPLAHKDALYVRSYYDGMTVSLPNGPLADEIAVIFCAANRGRFDARVGGLPVENIVGQDGLV